MYVCICTELVASSIHLFTHVLHMCCILPSPLPTYRYRVLTEFDAAGSFGVDPVTGDVFIATKLDYDFRYVSTHAHTHTHSHVQGASRACDTSCVVCSNAFVVQWFHRFQVPIDICALHSIT